MRTFRHCLTFRRFFRHCGLLVPLICLTVTATEPVTSDDESGAVYAPLFTEIMDRSSVHPAAWLRPIENGEADAEIVSDLFEESVGTILPVSVARRRMFPIASRSFLWHDPARRRSVPVRIFHPSDRREERFPVIVFSHGLGGSISRCSYLGTAWASRGFVVVMIQHPGSDENVWKGKLRIRHELQESYRHNWTGRTRARDIRFVLDRLEQLAEQGHWLASIMDLDRIGAGGYDLGCLAAMLVAGQRPPDRGASLFDPRIRAVLAMSPPVNRPSGSFRDVYAPIRVPAFFITGTEDDGIIGHTKAHQRRIPFDSLQTASRYLVTLRGADHQIYGGSISAFRARDDKPYQAMIVRASSCFWQAVLRNDESARTVLDGYGLNSMFGGMAVLERRVRQEENAGEQRSENEPVREGDSVSVEDGDQERPRIPGATPSFPITRVYRNLTTQLAERGRR